MKRQSVRTISSSWERCSHEHKDWLDLFEWPYKRGNIVNQDDTGLGFNNATVSRIHAVMAALTGRYHKKVNEHFARTRNSGRIIITR